MRSLLQSARAAVCIPSLRFLRIRADPEKFGAAARFCSISAHYRTVQYILHLSTFLLLLLFSFSGTSVKLWMLNLSIFVSLAFKFQIVDLLKFVSFALKFQIFDLSQFVSLACFCKMQAHSTMRGKRPKIIDVDLLSDVSSPMNLLPMRVRPLQVCVSRPGTAENIFKVDNLGFPTIQTDWKISTVAPSDPPNTFAPWFFKNTLGSNERALPPCPTPPNLIVWHCRCGHVSCNFVCRPHCQFVVSVAPRLARGLWVFLKFHFSEDKSIQINFRWWCSAAAGQW